MRLGSRGQRKEDVLQAEALATTDTSWDLDRFEPYVHPAMSFCGGVAGAYAFLARGGLLGAAQTSNLIEMLLDFLGGNIEDFIIRIAIFVLYAGAIIAAYFLNVRAKESKYSVCLLSELACVVLAGLIPATVNPLLALCPVFFMSAFQWMTFTDADHYGSSTIFSTNNLKQTVISTLDYLRTKDEKARVRAAFFARTLLLFHLGVVAGYFACVTWDVRGIWASAPVMLAVLAWEEARR